MSSFDSVFDQLNPFIQARMEATRTPGLAVAFFERERISRVSTFGLADLEAKIPVGPQTLFEIGSITKTFTAVAVLQAVERGLLDLDRPVSAYLPWFQVQTEHEPITLHHLLTHSAGLVGVIDRSPDIREAVWALRETETAGAPGSRFFYSDAGYQALTLVLQAVLEQPFGEIIRTHIFEPLGMTASEATITHRVRPRLAKGYQSLYDDRPFHLSHPLFPAPWIETSSGDCSIVSTAEDMARFARMLLNHGRGPKVRLLSEASYALMTQPHFSAGWCEYGYGLMRQAHEGITHLGHGGGMPGYTAEIIIDPDNEIGLAVLSTDPRPGGLFWKMMSLWQAIYQGQPVAPVDLTWPDPYHIENGPEYAGAYHGPNQTLVFTAENGALFLHHQGQQIRLENRGTDRFYGHHPDFERFLFQFGRSEPQGDERPGDVIEVLHGADWYAGDAYAGPTLFDYPPAWQAYPGHYRSHNPWQTNFRIVLRKGELFLVWPSGDEEALIPYQDHEFHVGDEGTPERIRFDHIVSGQALRATLSACAYYRFFTP